jgi:GDPmannose 4,6-dehydratase
MMLQQPEPDDYVVATGESHSVREFLELAASICGVDWKKHIEKDPRYFRPTEVNDLCGDSSKARKKLGWAPKVTFTELVKMMVQTDLELAQQEKTLTKAGHVVERGASQQ